MDRTWPGPILFYSLSDCQRQAWGIGTLALNAARKAILINKSAVMNGNLEGIVAHAFNE